MECLIENPVRLVALHESCVQRPVEILAASQARCLDRLDRIEHLACADGKPRAAQHACEMNDIFGKPARTHETILQDACAAARISSRIRAASLPCTRAMSS